MSLDCPRFIFVFFDFFFPGSLLSELKRQGLASGISSGNSGSGYEASTNFCTFEINVQLTTTGRERLDEVLALIMAKLTMIRKVRAQRKLLPDGALSLPRVGTTVVSLWVTSGGCHC